MSIISNAQEFAPVGATWIFTKEYCFSDPLCGYYSIKSTKDSIIHNKTVSVLEKVYWGNEVGVDTTLYMYGENKKVYIYDFLSDAFNLLYDFNLQAGDTIIIQDSTDLSGYYFDPLYSISFFEVKVDSVNEIIIDTENLIVQYTSPTVESQGQFFDKIIESIGNTSHFLGYSNPIPIGGYLGFLICYTDAVIYYNPTGTNCSVGLPKQTINDGILLYPNPFRDEILISGIAKKDYNLIIEDLTGKMVHVSNGKADQNVIKLNLNFLSNGTYLIKIITNEKLLTQKLIKL